MFTDTLIMKLKPGGNLNFGLCEGFCVVFKAPKWRGGGSKKQQKTHFFSPSPPGPETDQL